MATRASFSLTTSFAPLTPQDRCTMCEERKFDVTCTCGDKFDFNCIHQHIEQVGAEIEDNVRKTYEKLKEISALEDPTNETSNAEQIIIDSWKRKRIQDINDIVDEFSNKVQQRKEIFKDIPNIRENFEVIYNQMNQPTHENLNSLIEYQCQITNALDDYQTGQERIQDDTKLDAALISKINPSILQTNVCSPLSNMNNHELITIETEQREPVSNDERISDTDMRRSLELTTLTSSQETLLGISTHEPTDAFLARECTITTNSHELPTPTSSHDQTAVPEEIRELVNTDTTQQTTSTTENRESVRVNGNSINDANTTNHEEFDAGLTRQIQRANSIVIPVANDRYAGTLCCHDNQLLYNEIDSTTQKFRLVFISDINDVKAQQFIDWREPDVTHVAGDNEWIQDIIYSTKLAGYLILNRSRLRLFTDTSMQLTEYYLFPDRTMKRLSCSETSIYLIVSQNAISYNGDEIIVMHYDKDEQVTKTFRDIMPNQINRGAGPIVGEITDLTVMPNEQIALGYRLERRHEVGICVFNVSNDNKIWSCIKRLLLHECWHQDSSYTPRMDWCATLNVVILIEYMTGHLIMLDPSCEVNGECRFMNVENQKESPINLTLSTNNWFCTRFPSSINIYKIISE
ncbi:unnamed protein product [Rotaria socialis]|uniref:Uncharacterized protein n=1 Tax=Rotaria socialis TaxID=392032 RepID=A0A817NCG7_9BILA|nr:unnamed protein product [Rotaria socialis]CAF4181797.1 unnamed protein product [Rotaria socialis]